jgi:hypothetical protein
MIVLSWRVRTSLEKASSFGLSVAHVELYLEPKSTYLILS